MKKGSLIICRKPIPLSDFKVKLSLRIDWSELDIFGHVNNVSYFKYLQAARLNYWEKIGLWQHYEATKLGPMLASATCDFQRPLFYPGSIVIHSAVAFIKNTSFGMTHHILNDKGELAAAGADVMVMYDFNRNEKMPLPSRFRAAIESLEGRSF